MLVSIAVVKVCPQKGQQMVSMVSIQSTIRFHNPAGASSARAVLGKFCLENFDNQIQWDYSDVANEG